MTVVWLMTTLTIIWYEAVQIPIAHWYVTIHYKWELINSRNETILGIVTWSISRLKMKLHTGNRASVYYSIIYFNIACKTFHEDNYLHILNLIQCKILNVTHLVSYLLCYTIIVLGNVIYYAVEESNLREFELLANLVNFSA